MEFFENNSDVVNIEKSSLKLGKEDFSSGLLSFKLGKILREFIRNNYNTNFSQSDIISDSIYKRDQIVMKLSELNISNYDLQSIEIKQNGKIYVDYLKNGIHDKIFIDFNDNNEISLGNYKDVEEKKLIDLKNTIKNIEDADKILQAMEYIFDKNRKDFFGELNYSDVVDTDKFGKDLEGGNLKFLQSSFNGLYLDINSISIEDLPVNVKNDILKQKKKYFEIVMGIGDKYEGSINLISESKEGYLNLKNTLVENYSVSKLLDILTDWHRKIDENDYQSTSVENSYKLLMDTFNESILEKIKHENSTDEDILRFSKIITGRGVYNGNYGGNYDDWKSADIDDNLRDQKTSNEAIMFLMTRKGGILEKINSNKSNNNLDIQDEKVNDKKPSDIINNLRKSFKNNFKGDINIINNIDRLLGDSGYKDVLNLGEIEYHNLNYEQKVKISVLYRVFEKLENHMGKIENLEKFSLLFNEVALEYHKDMILNIEGIFGSNFNFIKKDFWTGKRATDYNLSGIDIEIFELFQSINGNGLLNFSDNSIENLKTGGKFAGVLSVAMISPAILLPAGTGLLSFGAAAGLSSSIASILMNPKGYYTVEESIIDIGSDLVLGSVTGLLGGALAGSFEITGGKGIIQYIKDLSYVQGSTLSGWKNASIFALDLTFLGILPETGRMILVDKTYNNKELLK